MPQRDTARRSSTRPRSGALGRDGYVTCVLVALSSRTTMGQSNVTQGVGRIMRCEVNLAWPQPG
jgi:hypothetical protein